MAQETFVIEVDGLRKMERDFDFASKTMNAEQLVKMNTIFELAFRAVRTATHVQTDKLRLSGRSDTHYDGSTWSGEITFLRNPGVFELARGDAPTLTHPEGGHHFFNAVEPFIPSIQEEINEIIQGLFNGAPL